MDWRLAKGGALTPTKTAPYTRSCHGHGALADKVTKTKLGQADGSIKRRRLVTANVRKAVASLGNSKHSTRKNLRSESALSL